MIRREVSTFRGPEEVSLLTTGGGGRKKVDGA